jgi:hypothetical protein
VAAKLPEGPPSFRAIRLLVGEQQRRRITKHAGRVFKADAVLLLV